MSQGDTKVDGFNSIPKSYSVKLGDGGKNSVCVVFFLLGFVFGFGLV